MATLQFSQNTFEDQQFSKISHKKIAMNFIEFLKFSDLTTLHFLQILFFEDL